MRASTFGHNTLSNASKKTPRTQRCTSAFLFLPKQSFGRPGTKGPHGAPAGGYPDGHRARGDRSVSKYTLLVKKKLHSTKRCISAICPSFLRNEACTTETQSTRDPGHTGPGALQALQCIRRGDLTTLYVKKN